MQIYDICNGIAPEKFQSRNNKTYAFKYYFKD